MLRLRDNLLDQVSAAERQALAVPADQGNVQQKALAALAAFMLASYVPQVCDEIEGQEKGDDAGTR